MTHQDPQPAWSDAYARASDGDRRTLDEWLVRQIPRLRAFVRLRAGPLARALDDTGDLVQSVCREILDKAVNLKFENEAAFRHWVFTEAARKIAKRARYQVAAKRDVRQNAQWDESLAACYSSFASPSELAAAREQIERLESAFDELEERQRDLITMAFVTGLSRAEIGQRLGTTEGAVRTALHRALARLAHLLDRPRER